MAREPGFVQRLQTFRRDLHRHPEVGWETQRTVEQIVASLSVLGDGDFTIQEVITEVTLRNGTVRPLRGPAGLIATLRVGEQGRVPVIGLSADMDALRIPEATNRFNGAYRSQVEGVGHQCGHDLNATSVLGAAWVLHALYTRGRLPDGEYRFLWRPAEEALAGAAPMIAAGAMRDMAAVFGLHADPTKDIGTVASRAGAMMVGAGRFQMSLGDGSTAETRQSVQRAVAQITKDHFDDTPTIDDDYLSSGRETGPGIVRVFPQRDDRTLVGGFRFFAPVDTMAEALAAACGPAAECALRIDVGLPSLVNGEIAHTEARTAIEQLGLTYRDATRRDIAHMTSGRDPARAGRGYPSDDHSRYSVCAHNTFMFLGVAPPGETAPGSLHTPTFGFADEEALPIGTAVLAMSALNWAQHQPDTEFVPVDPAACR